MGKTGTTSRVKQRTFALAATFILLAGAGAATASPAAATNSRSCGTFGDAGDGYIHIYNQTNPAPDFADAALENEVADAISRNDTAVIRRNINAGRVNVLCIVNGGEMQFNMSGFLGAQSGNNRLCIHLETEATTHPFYTGIARFNNWGFGGAVQRFRGGYARFAVVGAGCAL